MDPTVSFEIDKKSFGKAFINAVLTYLALSLVLDNPGISGSSLYVTFMNLVSSFEGFHIYHVILFPFLLLFYYQTEASQFLTNYRHHKTVLFLSAFFSLCMLLGYSFQNYGSWDIIKGLSNGQLIKSFLYCAGLAILFTYLISFLYNVFDGRFIKSFKQFSTPDILKKINEKIAAHPLITLFLTLVILNIPYMIVSCPGIIMGDAGLQFIQGFPELADHLDLEYYGMIPNGYTTYNLYHPLAHTLLIHFFLGLGKSVFHSFTIGIFLYSLTQALFFWFAIAFAFSVLIKTMQRKAIWVYFWICICIAFHPILHHISFLVTKDVYYCAFLLIVIAELYQMICDQHNDLPISRKSLIICILGILGMTLFRNEAKYIVTISLLLMALIYKPLRKFFFPAALGVMLFCTVLSQVVYPHFHIIPGSPREMLSVPFQQTARYVKYYSDEVTDQEEETINKVLKYFRLAESYDPMFADKVKNNLYRNNATKEDLIEYLKTWFRMGLKHPKVYIQATINNYYQYLYPDSGSMITNTDPYWESEISLGCVNEGLVLLGDEISYPKSTEKFRKFADDLYSYSKNFPVINTSYQSAAYIWMLLTILCWCIKEKSQPGIALLCIPFFIMLCSFAGPTNGYYGRYTYPIMASLPYLLLMIFRLSHTKKN